MGTPICKYYPGCFRGDQCRFLHEMPSQAPAVMNYPRYNPADDGQKLCQFFQQGNCRYGSGCHMKHEVANGGLAPGAGDGYGGGYGYGGYGYGGASGGRGGGNDPTHPDTWVVSAKECRCCAGYIYGCANCGGGQCQCVGPVDQNAMPGDAGDDDDDSPVHEKYADCYCCKGRIFNCKGTVCELLGVCGCASEDMPERDGTEGGSGSSPRMVSSNAAPATASNGGQAPPQHSNGGGGGYDPNDKHPDTWVPEHRDCSCCRGYVYGCKAETCTGGVCTTCKS